MTLGAGVVLAEALGDPFRLKWPNDLLDPQGRKVAGILAEAEWTAGKLDAVIVGIGVNIVSSPPGVPATNLREHGVQRTREELAETLRAGLAGLRVEGLRDRWRAVSCTLGRPVQVGDITGTAQDIDVDGALLVDVQGRVRRVLTGDLGFLDTL